MRQVAITGAAGNVGSGIRKYLLQRGYGLLLLDRKAIGDCGPRERAVCIDINDQAALEPLLRGCAAVIHLAACTTDAPWAEQIEVSVEGTVSVFEAARAAGVRRVVYASSHHVVGLHPRAPHGPRVGTEAPLRPDSRYGVAKAFGESVAALFACKYGFQVLVVRIGNVADRPADRRRLGSWISWRDFGQLVAIGLEHPGLVLSTVYGTSDTTGRHYDNADAYALGFLPQDGRAAADFEAQVLREDPAPAPGSPEAVSAPELTLGGMFSGSEYVGGTERLLTV